MPKTIVGTPDPPDEDPEKAKVEAEWLAAMAEKTDSELVAAYIAAAQQPRPFIHPSHVVRILKLAALGLGAGAD